MILTESAAVDKVGDPTDANVVESGTISEDDVSQRVPSTDGDDTLVDAKIPIIKELMLCFESSNNRPITSEIL